MVPMELAPILWVYPPRLRGNPDFLPGNLLCGRSIPAPAGEPPSTVTLATVVEVYPRAWRGNLRLQ